MPERRASNATWVVRASYAKDLAAFRDLLRDANLPDAGLHEQFGPTFLVATEEKTIVGGAGVEIYPPYALLRSVALLPQRRSKGIGAALVTACLDVARDRGVQQLYLLTETAESYFTRFGFARVDRAGVPEPIRRTTEFAHACPASATVMVLDLAAAKGPNP